MSVTVTKLGADEPPATSVGHGDTWTKVDGVPNPFIPVGGGRRRRQPRQSTKTFPKGILRKTSKARINPTRNPSKSDTRRSVRMMTERGIAKTRKKIHEKAAKMKISSIAEVLLKKKIISEKNAKKIPPADLRMLYRDSVGAGLL